MKCIICKHNEYFGFQFNALCGEPFFCDRCLFLILMKDRQSELANYCSSVELSDDTVSTLAPENIWKEGAGETSIKHNVYAKITKHELEVLLLDYASAAYWHGEDTGNYGAPDPEAHVDIFDKIWKTIEGE